MYFFSTIGDSFRSPLFHFQQWFGFSEVSLLLGALAHLTTAELEALYALLVPLGAHTPRTADCTHAFLFFELNRSKGKLSKVLQRQLFNDTTTHYLTLLFHFLSPSIYHPNWSGVLLCLLGALAHLATAELEALYTLLVPLGAHTPRTADCTHVLPS
jgi:hypothetical protein